jgi:predicted nucleotidyltransferase
VRSKSLGDLKLDPHVRAALEEARRQLTARFEVDRLVLYGSVARGEADEESDADLLIVLANQPDLEVENQITRLVMDINLQHDTNLSELIVGRNAWDCGMVSAMPIHTEVDREGIRL